MVSEIRELCKENRISLMELNNRIGWKRGTIDRWDKNKPSIDKVIPVADFFDVSIDYLCGRTNEKKPADKVNELSDDEKLIIELFRKAPRAKKDFVKSLIITASNLLADQEEDNESPQ